MAIYIEDYIPDIKLNGLNTKKAVDFSGAPSVALPGGTTIAGASNITSTSATAFTVAAAGTNYGLQVDESASNAVTGLKIASTATGTNLLLSVISSGTNDGMTLKAKGNSSIVVTAGTDNASIFQVQNAAGSNTAFNVDTSTASNATGISVQSKAVGSGIILSVTSSGTNEDIAINSKGTGKFRYSPGSNSTTSLQATKADGTTVILDIDSSNARIGINQATPSEALHVSGAGLMIDGQSSGHTGGFAVLDYSSGTSVARMYIQGFDNSTNGAFSVITQRANQTNSITPFSISTAGVVALTAGTAPAAAGSSSAVVLFSSTAALGLYFGSGAPTVSAAQGSLYVRTDGSSTSTRLYVNTNGSTTWTNVTTAA